jgi:hypothetical protein
VDLCHNGRTFAYGCGDPFDRAGTSVTDCEYAIDAGLQRKRSDAPIFDIGSSQDKPLAV